MNEEQTSFTLPKALYTLFCEIEEITKEELDTASKSLFDTQKEDIIKTKLHVFGQKMLVLGKQKEFEASDAAEAGDEEGEVRLFTEMDTLHAMINLLVSSMLTAEEVKDDSLQAKICKNFLVVLRPSPDKEVESGEEDEEDERPVQKTPDRKKLN